MAKQTPIKSKHALLWRIIATMALLVVGVYILIAHWNTVRHGLHTARHAQFVWVLTALALMMLTFMVAAAIYGLLALRRLRYWQTVNVEIAAAFANRLLPAGLGGLGLHGVYLYNRKHTAAEATAIVSVNNLLGIAAHLTLLVLILIVQPQLLHKFAGHYTALKWQYCVAAVSLALIILCLPIVRLKIGRFIVNLLKSLRLLRPMRVAGAALLGMLLTAIYTTILYTAARSLGIHLGVLQTFIVFSVGMLVGTVTPTPGGLVGAEAGLFAGFIGYGVSSPAAGAAVLLYRLITYWLPLAPGLVALLLARSRKLV